ncbi:MAG: VCBS repeat-containing protein [Deltaproteobacteria bacterium]|nr:VCBS repeat-containing protein [Deltaproteobacteria bacterium]
MFKKTAFIVFSFFIFVLSAGTSMAVDHLTAATDFDGDGLGDTAMYDASTNVITIRSSKRKKFIQRQIGSLGSIYVAGDYDGDGVSDLVAYHPITATWSYHSLMTGIKFDMKFGEAGYLPLPGHYRNRNCSDIAVYNAQTGHVAIRDCRNGQTYNYTVLTKQIPAQADYDCDGLTDLALFNRRSNKWTVYGSRMGMKTFSFGQFGDQPFPVDFDNDSCAEVAVYRHPGNYYVIAEKNKFAGRLRTASKKQWGLSGDRPFVASIDGDGRSEYAVYRSVDNRVYLKTASGASQIYNFGPRVQQVTPPVSDDPEEDYSSEESIVKYYAAQLCIRQPMEARDNFVSRCSKLVITAINRDYGDWADYYGYDFNATMITQTIGAIYPPDSLGMATDWVKSAPGILQSTLMEPVTLFPQLTLRNFADFDRDGRTNMLLINSRSDSSYTFNVVHDALRTTSYNLGINKYDVVAGDYDGDGRSDTVLLRSSRTLANEIEWLLLNAQGKVLNLHWGRVGDRPVAAEFNADGKYDPTVVRVVGSGLRWYVYLSTSVKISDIKFGKSSDFPFAADMDGDGRDDLVVARRVGSNIVWYYRPLQGATESMKVAWGLYGDRLLRPFDYNGDGRADLAVARTVGGNKQFFIKYTGSKKAKSVSFGVGSDFPLAGYYTMSASADIAVYRQSNATLYTMNILSGAVSAIPAKQSMGFPLASDGVRNINSKIGKSFEGVRCDVTKDFYDGAGGALWKPVSESHGNAIFLLPKEYQGTYSAEVLGSQGQLLTTAKFREYFFGGRAVMDTPMRASAMVPHAPITVRFQHNGVTVCYVTNNPMVRND